MARVESKTYICTQDKRESVPQTKQGVKGQLGNWMGEVAVKKELDKRFPGCMKGMIVAMQTRFIKAYSTFALSCLSKSSVKSSYFKIFFKLSNVSCHETCGLAFGICFVIGCAKRCVQGHAT